MLRIVHEGGEREAGPGTQVGLDELCRMAAQEMLGVALEAERQAYLERHAGAVDGEGRRVVVGNGYVRAREITTAAGRVAVQAPRVDDRRPGERYISALLPPYMRRSPKVTEVLPLLYLRGLSTGDFLPALSAWLGGGALRLDRGAAHGGVAGRARALAATQPGRGRLRLPLGGRRPLHRASRGGPARCLVLVGVRPDGRRSWWPCRTATVRTPSPGSCCGTCASGACATPSWRSATGRSGSGRRCGRSSPGPASSAAGCTRPRTSWRRCPSASRGKQRGRSTPSPEPRRAPGRWMRRAPSPVSSRSGRRRQRRSPTTSNGCSRSTTSRPSTTTCAPRTRSSPPSPRSAAPARHEGRRVAVGGTGDGLQAARRRAAALAAAPHLVAVVRAGGVFVDGVLQERAVSPDASDDARHGRYAA